MATGSVRKVLVPFLILLSLPLPAADPAALEAASANAVEDQPRKLFHFDKGTQGWWTFSKNHEIKLSGASEGADGTPGALNIFAKRTGGGGYLGAGVQLKYVIGKDVDIWPKYADGHISVWMKADKPATIRFELRAKGKGDYAVGLKLTESWLRFDIPFTSFKKGGAPLNLRELNIDEIAIIPPADGKGKTMLADEITLHTKPLQLEAVDVQLTGTVFDPAGKPLPGASVKLTTPSQFLLAETSTAADGRYQINTKLEAQAYLTNESATANNAGKTVATADLYASAQGYLDTVLPLKLEGKPITESLSLRTPAAPLKELKVQGNRIVDPSGNEVWLQGLCIDSLEWSYSGDNMMRALKIATDTWKSNAIRIPVHQKYWFGKGEYQNGNFESYRKLIDQLVEESAKRGAYLILDLHVFGFPAQEHVDFWKDAAARYKDNPAVLFDLFNEPHSISWEVWQKGGDPKKGVRKDVNVAENDIKQAEGMSTGMQALIDAVRSTGARNIVIAGGLDWGYDLSGVLSGFDLKDASGNGIVYSTHVYPWKSDWQKLFLNAAAKHPLFVGEVGCQDTPMPWQKSTESPETWAPDMIGCIQKYRLNWTGFSFHPGCGPRAVGDWQYTPTPYWGAYVKRALAGDKFEMKKMR